MSNRGVAGVLGFGSRTVDRAINNSSLFTDVARLSPSEARAEAIRLFKAIHPDMSNRMIAGIFFVDETTVRRALK